jgi:hypothetical protein
MARGRFSAWRWQVARSVEALVLSIAIYVAYAAAGLFLEIDYLL